jgi:hypothetical protein
LVRFAKRIDVKFLNYPEIARAFTSALKFDDMVSFESRPTAPLIRLLGALPSGFALTAIGRSLGILRTRTSELFRAIVDVLRKRREFVLLWEALGRDDAVYYESDIPEEQQCFFAAERLSRRGDSTADAPLCWALSPTGIRDPIRWIRLRLLALIELPPLEEVAKSRLFDHFIDIVGSSDHSAKEQLAGQIA